MRRTLLLFALFTFAFPALAQNPRNTAVALSDCTTLTCDASSNEGRFCFDKDDGSLWRCESSSWVRKDIPQCATNPPTGTCSGFAVCQVQNASSWGIYGCGQDDAWYTIAGAGDGQGYATMQDEGTPLTQRGTVNFTGAGITCTDSGSVTVCDVTSGSGDMTQAVYDSNADSTVDTAAALAANGANCSAGQYPLGVDASGAVESCTVDDDQPDTDAEVPDAISVQGSGSVVDAETFSFPDCAGCTGVDTAGRAVWDYTEKALEVGIGSDISKLWGVTGAELAHRVPMGTGSGVLAIEVQDCDDPGHLNYDQTTQTWSCGESPLASKTPHFGASSSQAADPSGDGTGDVFFDPRRGVIRGDRRNMNSGRLAYFASVHDIHEEDGDGTATGDEPAGYASLEQDQQANLIAKCELYGNSVCGMALQKDPDDASIGWPQSLIQSILLQNMDVGGHSTSHCAITMIGQEWADEFGTSEGAGYKGVQATTWDIDGDGTDEITGGGTVTITPSGTTFDCNGDGCEFDTTCRQWPSGDSTYSYSPEGAIVIIDTDGDGEFETDGSDFESYIESVSESGNGTITIADSFAATADCDGDGTAGASGANVNACNFAILSGPRQWTRDLTDVNDYIRSLSNDARYDVRWYSTPGQDVGGTGMASMYVPRGVEAVATWQGDPGASTEVLTYTDGWWGRRINAGCWDADEVEALVDTIVEAGASLIMMDHTPRSSGCTPGTNNWSMTAFNTYLERVKYWQDRGKAMFTTPDQVVELSNRDHRDSHGENMLLNNNFEHIADLDEDGSDTPVWWWAQDEADVSYDATWGGLKITADGASEVVAQGHKLHSGYYQASAFLRAESATTGVRICLRSKDEPGSLVAMAPTIWYVHGEDPVTEPAGDSDNRYNQCSPWIVRSGGNEERWVWGQFYVPPELDGIQVNFQVQYQGTGTLYAKEVGLVRANPTLEDGKYGGYRLTKNWGWSGLPQDWEVWCESGACLPKPFGFVWDPDSSTWTDEHELDVFGITARTTSEGLTDIFGIGKPLAVEGDGGDWHNGTSPSLRLGYSDSTRASESGFYLGQRSFSGEYLSFGVEGTSNAAAVLLSNHDGTTEPTFGFFPTNLSSTFGATAFALHDEEPGTGGIILRQHGDDTVSVSAGLRVGSTSDTADDGATLRHDATEDRIFADNDGDSTKDADENFIDTAIAGPIRFERNNIPANTTQQGMRTSFVNSAEESAYWPRNVVLDSLICAYEGGPVTASTITVRVRNVDDGVISDLNVVFDNTSSNDIPVYDASCTSNCAVDAGERVFVEAVGTGTLAPTTVDVYCNLFWRWAD